MKAGQPVPSRLPGEKQKSLEGAGKAPTSAFDDLVVYVGLTKSGLHTRFEQSRRGHKRQRASARINDRIASTLAAAKRLKVLVATPEPSEWNGLPVNTAAGLEAE